MEKNIYSEYINFKKELFKKYQEERKEQLFKHKDLIDKIKNQGFDKDNKILRALEKNNFDLDKAIEYLKEREEMKIGKFETFKKLKEKAYKEFFPEDKEFDWDKFKQKKEELRAFRKLRKEEQYLAYYPEDKGKEFNWKKFRCMKKSERLAKKLDKQENKKEKETKKPSSSESEFTSDEMIISNDQNIHSKKNPKFKEIQEDYKKFKNFKKQKREMYLGKESPEEKEKRIDTVVKLINEKVIESVYFDGNNMLFVDDVIRKDCLNKNTIGGEMKLGKICFEYAKKTGMKSTLLVFDNTKQVYEKESEGVLLKVSSAYPEFESSDDAFKVWAGGLDAEKLKKILFVTSDRELTDRLRDKKVSHVMKSGEFMKEAKKVLGEAYLDCLKSN